MTVKKKERKNSHCANIILISLAWREAATREILDFFFFPFRSERKCQVLSNPSISPSSEARIPRALGWESESFHMWANHTLKFYEAPLCRKKGPLPLKLLASTERHLLPEANWECSCEALLSSPLF